jgi:hypothetical protein
VFLGLVRFSWPTIFSLLALIVPKKYIQMLPLGVVQFGKSVPFRPAVAGFLMDWCSWVHVHRFGMFLLR